MTERLAVRLLMLTPALIMLCACAKSPVLTEDDRQGNQQGNQVMALEPAQVLDGQGQPGDRVVWGGRIVEVHNFADLTEIHVVSFPLDRADRPRLQQEPGARFLLRHPGFLEPVQYAPGRFLTVLGRLEGVERAIVGEHALPHPVVQAERLHLWPADAARWQPRTRFSIGLGVSL